MVGAVGGLGFLLLAGTLLSELLEPLGVPHLTSYIVAGFVGGPSVLGLVDSDVVNRLSSVDTLSIALSIALAGGCELRLDTLPKSIGMRELSLGDPVSGALITFTVRGAASPWRSAIFHSHSSLA